ncbi:MAG TPA: AAA family ATPase, partial [Fimbriimonadaceae bacterium]|nr:AAA family ATPase [Fimbriimonadaceae bacterium]
ILVVEDLDVGLRIARTGGWNRIVTLEGEIVYQSGAVTGGAASKTSYGIIQRKADLTEIQRELRDLERLIGESEKSSAARTAEIDGLRREAAQQQASLLELRDEAEETRLWRQSVLEELHAAQKGLQKLETERAKLAAENTALEPPNVAQVEADRDDLLTRLAARSADADAAKARMQEAELRLAQAQQRTFHARRRLQHAQEAERGRERKRDHLGPEREKTKAEIESARSAREQALAQRAEADKRLDAAQIRKHELLEESLRLVEESKGARANAQAVVDAAHQAELDRARLDAKRGASAQRLYEEYGLTEHDAVEQAAHTAVPEDAAALVPKLRRELKSLGDVNLGAIEAFERLDDRCQELSAQRDDITEGIKQVEAGIRELDRLTRERFLTTFEQVRAAFAEILTRLFGGGSGDLKLSDQSSILESGIEIDVVLPGKKRQRLELLSGGERSLCGVAFLFALLQVRPSPLVVLDEVDAPLDGRNVERFIDMLRDFSKVTQFIVITHNPTTIEAAPTWLGVTMQEPGVSTLVPARAPARAVVADQREPITNQTVQMVT